MGLSRLNNFLKSGRGTILYVDPSSLDSTDSIENSGNSLTRPFKTIQRALIEAARFSYQRGLNNDRFNKTSILLYPGDHLVDNRPGYIPTATTTYSERSGQTGLTDLTQWDLDTIYDLSTPDNALYKLNSVHGGVIIPRGTSIVGMDLRKTRIRPTYVPNPENDNIERSCVFRVTGGCYLWQFTILDADPNGTCYKDYTTNIFVPNFSHHKLSGFEYADGVNGVNINDDFLNGVNAINTSRTDLDMYYEKVAAVYGASSGRVIQPDFDGGVSTVDIQPVIDEYRIVGPKGASVGITSIRSGDGATPTPTITVDLVETVEGLSVDSPIQISGVSAAGYDGQYVISSVLSNTQVTYKVQNVPTNALPGVTGSALDLVVDTVTSASPYIFNISLRSVYGMCGLLADGNKATGFKSMVVAQYTGIGLQKDDNAFVKYNDTSGIYQYSNTIANLHTNSRSRFIPEYENFHIKATNDSFLQLVSVFAIGYAQHFVTENGGDIALNNSNSNFGAKALVSSGFRREAFNQDDHGYITHIIPPKEIQSEEINIEFGSIDVGITTLKSAGAGTTTSLYLYGETNQNILPKVVIDGYHIGAKQNEQLIAQVYQNGGISTYSSRIVMPYGPYNSTQSSSEKSFTVDRGINGINNIVTNTLTLTQQHSFINGESIRIIANDGNLPDGLNSDQVYYAITKESATGIGTDQIRIAKTLSDAINGSVAGNAIGINNKGGTLSIVSRVSDKNAGDIGHPVQWDTGGYWYVNVSTADNGVYTAINSLGIAGLGEATSRSYVVRKPDFRSLIDTVYRVRYVLPKNSSTTARPPVNGFILQESNDIIGSGTNEISQLYSGSGSISSTNLRNPKFIATASWSSSVVTVRSELPHGLKVNDEVEIVNVSPTGYNGTYTVTSIISAKEFTYALGTNPGAFVSDTSNRSTSLPYFRRKKYNKTYQVYKTEEIQPYVFGSQDGIYYLTLINHSNSPTVTPFSVQKFAQPIENLYPQTNKDNPNSDPNASDSHALPSTIGEVVINDPQNSITKETLESLVVGYGITNIRSSSGIAHTIYTAIDHGLAGITSASIVSGGSNYGSSGSFTGSLYNARLVGFAGSTTGSNATAKITLTSGAITGVTIIDGGSAYGIGNTLTVVGIATTTSHVIGVVRVETISNNIGDTLKVSGVSSASNSSYNTLYRVSGISTGKSKEINVISAETFTTFSTSGLGVTITSNAGYLPTGKVVGINTLAYNPVTGLATAYFASAHGFGVDNKLSIRGANQTVFNGDFIVTRLNSLTSLVVNVGVETSSITATGTLYAYRSTLTSYGGDLIKSSENISGRLNYQYAGITTTIGNTITPVLDLDTNDTNYLIISNAVSLGLTLGDYLLVNNEIFRIRKTVTSNSVNVYRALLGSPRQNHTIGSVVRRIKVTPVELRRNSIIRASGHTFEYLGFGPGNYSTSLPDKQDRVLSNSEIFLAQATKTDGGVVVYTGMNSDGDFFAGNKKTNSSTGKEETYDTPIATSTGENDTNILNIITDTQKLFVEASIKVDGGKDKNTVSQFDGPVVFTNKITSNSDIETNSILLQGEEEVSRKFSISDTKPSVVGNYGDVKFNSTPQNNKNSGWIYTTDNEWKPFGWITDISYGVGVSTSVSEVGISSLINFVGSNITIDRTFNSNSGITTLNFTATGLSTTYASNAGIATYASNAGIATYASNAGIATYASDAGTSLLSITSNSTDYATTSASSNYATSSGIATYSSSSGIATYSSSSGIATYATSSGISTSVIGGISSVTELNVSDISTLANVRITSGIITASSGIVTYYGDGSKLSGIGGVSIDQNGVNSKLPVLFASIGSTSILGSSNSFTFNPARSEWNWTSSSSVERGSAQSGNLSNNRYIGYHFRYTIDTTDSQGISLTNVNSASNADCSLSLSKSRGGSQTQNGDALGTITFQGYAPTPPANISNRIGAAIKAFQDGITQQDNIPGRLSFYTTPVGFGTNAPIERMTIRSSGNIGVNTPDPTSTLHVVGSFAATTKAFIIDHPTKEGKKLCYASLEGPENGVYVRGKSKDNKIELPEYWTKLVDNETITVNLTPIGDSALPRVEKIDNNFVYVFSKEDGELNYYYIIFAERCDVEKLITEY